MSAAFLIRSKVDALTIAIVTAHPATRPGFDGRVKERLKLRVELDLVSPEQRSEASAKMRLIPDHDSSRSRS